METTSELLISADSHVIEPPQLWAERLPVSFQDQAPRYPQRSRSQWHEGGSDPAARVREMATDGVSAEVLYPSLALKQFGFADAALQEACFRVYNDWIIEYCAHAPDRLFGLGLISMYKIDNALREIHRCKEAGLRGVLIWQVPPEGLSFTSDHYERFWAAAQDLQMPVNLHISTRGPGIAWQNMPEDVSTGLKRQVHMKMLHAANALLEIIVSGALENFPHLKIVLVENEVSWLPFVISQWDRYYVKRNRYTSRMSMPPSEYFQRQVYATFFNDPPTRWLFGGWGSDSCMWSNDFPHANSTWPKSREVIARDLGHLPDATRARLLHENVSRLYDLPAITPVAA